MKPSEAIKKAEELAGINADTQRPNAIKADFSHRIMGLPKPPKARRINIEKLVATVSTLDKNGQPSLSGKQIGSLYQVRLDEGGQKWLLFSDQPIKLGEQTVIVDIAESEIQKQVISNLDDAQVSLITSKVQGKKWNDDEPEGTEKRREVAGWMDSRLLVMRSAFTRQELEEVLKESNKSGYELIHKLLTHGMKQYDEALFSFLPGFVLEANIKRTNLMLGAKTAPHSFIVTGTKAGKSSAFQIITGEPTSGQLSRAGTLGYTGNNEIIRGDLHDRTRAFVADEPTTQSVDEGVGDALFTIEELGQTRISKGKGHDVRSIAPIIVLANPRAIEQEITNHDEQKIVYSERISELFSIFTDNADALGSRTGFYFDPNNDEIKGGHGSVELAGEYYDEMIVAQEALRSIADSWRDEFTDALTKHRDWHEKPYSDDFIKGIRSIAPKCGFKVLREYVSGAERSHRHARGEAFRLAFLKVKMRAEPGSDEELLKIAEQEIRGIEERNLASYIRAVNIAGDSELVKIRARANLKNLKPEYLRLFVLTTLEYVVEEKPTRIIPFSALEPYFLAVREREGISWDDPGTMYRSWAKVSTPTLKRRGLSSDLRTFGLRYLRVDDTISIDDDKTLEIYQEEYLKSHPVNPVYPYHPSNPFHPFYPVNHSILSPLQLDQVSLLPCDAVFMDEMDDWMKKNRGVPRNQFTVRDTVEKLDLGEGVALSVLLQKHSQAAISKARESGDIFEPNAGRFKVL